MDKKIRPPKEPHCSACIIRLLQAFAIHLAPRISMLSCRWKCISKRPLQANKIPINGFQNDKELLGIGKPKTQNTKWTTSSKVRAANIEIWGRGGWAARGERKKQTNKKKIAYAKGAPKAFVKTNGWMHLLQPSRPNISSESSMEAKTKRRKLHV